MKQFRVVLVAGALLALAALGWYVVDRSSFQALRGSLVVNTDGQILIGSPHNGEYTPLVATGDAAPFSSAGVLTPDGTRGVALRSTSDRVELVTFSVQEPSDMRVVATHQLPATSSPHLLTNPVWSPDGRLLAYRFYAPQVELLPSVGGDAGGFFDPTAGFPVLSGSTLPEELRAAVYVAEEGNAPRRLIPGVPVAFSPDTTRILVQDDATLFVVALANGERVQVSGAPLLESGEALPVVVRSVPGGETLAVWVPGARVTVYAINWEEATLSFVGDVPQPETVRDVIYDSSTGKALLAFVDQESGARFDVYRIANSLGTPRAYPVGVPEGAAVLQWFTK